MSRRTKKIGFFDSGFGGLGILKHVVAELPEYDFVYLGDTARVPYGNRSPEIVYEFTVQALKFLFTQKCDLVVLACNTASSDALRRIQTEFLPIKYPKKKVLGVLIPAIEEAVEVTRNNRIGVIATRGTVESKAFVREIHNRMPEAKVFQSACPLLVPVIENGEDDNLDLLNILFERYLTPLKEKNIDTLILGCTHYGIIKNQIHEFLNREVVLIGEGPAVAMKLKQYLERHGEIEKSLSMTGKLKFFTTDLTLGFEDLGKRFFGREIAVEKIVLK